MLSSVTNALRVLEYLVEEGEAGVSEISRALDLTIGTVYRMVSTLSALGYVEQNPTNRRYNPGPKIPTLARHMTGGQDFVALARPHLERLMVQSGETVNLAVLRETEVVYIDRAVTNQPVGVSVRIGSRVPVYCTGLGKAMMAFQPEEVMQAYLDLLPGMEATAYAAPPAPGDFAEVLQDVRRNGFAEDRNEFSADIACVAAPILDAAGTAKAAISVAVLSSRASDRLDDIAPLVKEAAKELSELLQLTGNQSVA